MKTNQQRRKPTLIAITLAIGVPAAWSAVVHAATSAASYSEAQSDLARGDFAAARNVAEAALRKDPKDYRAYWDLADSIYVMNQVRAQQYFLSKFHLGAFHAADLDVWKNALANVVSLDPRPTYRAVAKCKLDMTAGQSQQALTDCATAYRVSQGTPLAWDGTFAFSQALSDDHRFLEAYNGYRKAYAQARQIGDARKIKDSENHYYRMSKLIPHSTIADRDREEQDLQRDMGRALEYQRQWNEAPR